MPFKDSLNNETASTYFPALLQYIDAAAIGVTPGGLVVLWNRAAERLLGYRSEEIMGRSASIIVPPNSSKQEDDVLKRLRIVDRMDDLKTQRRTKDGRIVDVYATYNAVRVQGRDLSGVLIILKESSERERSDKAERDQLFLSAIVSSADDAIISKDLNGTVTSWNTAAETLFGYTAEEMIGQPIARLIPADHSSEEPQILSRIRRGERIAHYETQRLTKDGRAINVSLTVSPIRDQLGQIIGASKIVHDISDRLRWQEAEAAQSFLGSIVASAEDAIISKTLEGVVTSWNEAAEKLFGYTAAEIIGKQITLLIPPHHLDEEPQIIERIRRGERIKQYETKRLRKDGTLVDVALSVSPIRDSLGRIVGASKIARDISEHKRAKQREHEALEQAERAKQRAEEANRVKDEFLATISHELRTPMTAILGWSRVLLSGQYGEELQRKALETIDRNARSQAQLIEDLLDVSRIVSGKLRIDFDPVDLATVVNSAVEALRPQAEEKHIQIQTVLSTNAGPILGDAQRLQQVIWNLLSNAIRFSNSEGTIKVELKRVESQVELRVIDNGIGIKEEFLGKIFDRFTQADSSLTRSKPGLGMGLAIVKALVEVHGGVVTASSAGEGQGATFTVKLPISAVRLGSPRTSSLSPIDRMLEHSELVGVKVLVVDDEKDTRDLISFVLNQVGALVETAESAEFGLQKLDEWGPDILVADIGMPGVDGYELIRIIRENRMSSIPAVALTAMARIEDRMKALNAGYQMHVAKPIEPTELISIVSGLRSLVNRTQEEEAT
jgi:PAS domain S-box-containing protein